MKSGQLPRYIEPRKFADQESRIVGSTKVSRLPRLADFQCSEDKPVEVDLRFYHEAASGHRIVEGSITTALQLTCQRCLEPMQQSVSAVVSLIMVWSEVVEGQTFPESYDPWLITEDKMDVSTLLEDEILLSLPVVAMHDECPVTLPVSPEPEGFMEPAETENPFAVLASLKEK
ncbi:MAG TPA: YceD family protein [Alcanivoracaceae bacterium]|nr:YceD family protein [Alcanivoracaceae bacterium]